MAAIFTLAHDDVEVTRGLDDEPEPNIGILVDPESKSRGLDQDDDRPVDGVVEMNATRDGELAPTGSSPAEVTAYRAAEMLNTPQGWQQFLTQYPSRALVDRTRAKLFELQNSQQEEALAYEISKAGDTEEGSRQYLTRFPIGAHIGEAKSRIDQLEAARKRKEREPAA